MQKGSGKEKPRGRRYKFTTKEVAQEAKRVQIEMGLAPTGWHDEAIHIEGRELERLAEKAMASLPARNLFHL